MTEKTDKSLSAGIIIIGDEILSGRTQDANTPYMANWLNEHGIRVGEVRIVPDDKDAIVDAVNAFRDQFDYVFTTGGIGPTHDDITADSLAKAFDVPLERRREAVDLLREHYGEEGLTEARLRMARIPKNANLIDNPISRAPGFCLENVFAMAGIPAVMRAMLESIRHELLSGEPVLSRSVRVFLRESEIAEPLARIQEQNPDVAIGSYPFFRERPGASIVIRSTDRDRLSAVAEEVHVMIRALGAEPVEDRNGG